MVSLDDQVAQQRLVRRRPFDGVVRSQGELPHGHSQSMIGGLFGHAQRKHTGSVCTHVCPTLGQVPMTQDRWRCLLIRFSDRVWGMVCGIGFSSCRVNDGQIAAATLSASS
jgi:hypothetical protein